MGGEPVALRKIGNPLVWGLLKAMCRIITSCVFDLKAYGARHVPRQGGAMLIANHQSFLDPIILGVQLRRPLSYIAKTELFQSSFLGWLMRSLNTFPVRRGETDVGAVREALRRLREGRILVMFPEGTRSSSRQMGPIQSGIAMLVRRAGVPVIPAVIDGSFEAWPRGEKPRAHPIRVRYGPPLAVEGLKGAQIVDLIDRTLRKMLDELREGSSQAGCTR